MFVGNHSGYGVMEIFVLLSLWYRRFGFDRLVAGLCHDIGFWPPFSWVVLPIGGIRAGAGEAQRALNQKLDILVFPGGDLDALRPFGLRYSVRWGSRSGFIELAKQMQVPIIPIVNCGSHAQYTIMPGGRAVARALGLPRVRLEQWGVPVGALLVLASLGAWAVGWLSGGWVLASLAIAFCPNPTRMDINFLAPVDARALIAIHGSPQAATESLRRNMEQELRRMSNQRVTPWF
jgi:1-acyl-sn-glycerol-3-phosphate acyltransferase